MNLTLKRIAEQFSIKGTIKKIEPTGNGHINKTFKVTTDKRIYILQKINTNVFTNVDELMTNIVLVTEHLLEEDIFTLKYKPTLKGSLYYSEGNSNYRIYKYIPDCYCYEGIENLEVAKKYGEAFGQFHNSLRDLDATRLYETIPDFHNTMLRFKTFKKSVSKDTFGRAEEVKDEIKFISKNSKYYDLISKCIDNGEIPMRIVHNDPKVNNVLFDKATNDVKCIIDLDTVMPGSGLYDFGDGLRSIFTGANEDSTNLDLLKVNPEIYRACLEGYYSKCKDTLTPKEIELLPVSVLILALELAMRFLKDYLDGDVYFATDRDGQNLDRARTQIALAKDVLAHLDDLNAITKEVCK